MSAQMTAQETARAMLAVLDNGAAWGKNYLYKRGRYCMIGSSICLDGMSNDTWKVISGIIREQFPERVPDHCPSDPAFDDSLIEIFNDHELTTFADVRMVLEKAAAG